MCCEECCTLFLLLMRFWRMTSPQGMDELFWGRDHEDVNDWAERLTMAAEVRDLNADKLFKIAKLNLRGQAKEWFKKMQPVLADWAELRTQIVATPLWPSVGVKPNTWKSWRLGVFRDSRMFRARQQGAKHLALGCSWCHWKGLET